MTAYGTQDSELIKLVTGRQGKLESARTLWEQEWQDVADYVIPLREDIRGTRLSGERKGRKIYDGTAVSAAVLATDGIHGYHVSPAFPWFRAKFPKVRGSTVDLNDVPEVKEWLQEGVEEGIYHALNRSNFYDEMWQYIYDCLTLGTASIYSEEDLTEDRIVFETEHIGEIYIAENRYGHVDIRHRKRKLTARQAVQMFGEKTVSEPLLLAWKTDPFREFEFIHAIFPREEWDDRKKDSRNMRYASVWYQKDGNHLCRVSGYDEFPCAVWRYMQSGKEAYGRSPALLALSDIEGLNLMSKTILGAAQLAVNPPMNIPSDMRGKVQLKPGGQNYTDRPDMRITPVNTGINFPIGIDREQAKQLAIKERFHVDFFLMLASMEGRGQRTAYEVSELMAEKAAVLGAELGPLNRQLNKILDRVFQIEFGAGRIPPPPDVVYEMGGDRFDFIYMGPLAQAQREKFTGNSMGKFLIQVSQWAQLKPEVLDNLNADEAVRKIHENVGAPESILLHPDKVEEIRVARVEAMKQQSDMEQAMSVADGVKKVASADKDMGGQMTKMMEDAADAQA